MTMTPAPAPSAGAPHKKKQRGARPKHVPQRTCIACRTAAPKRSFVRVVRTPTGQVMIDPTGKLSGRGASVCGTRTCWQKALAGSLFERALRVELQEDDRATLRAFVDTLPVETAVEQPSAG